MADDNACDFCDVIYACNECHCCRDHCGCTIPLEPIPLVSEGVNKNKDDLPKAKIKTSSPYVGPNHHMHKCLRCRKYIKSNLTFCAQCTNYSRNLKN